jgi:hypothetical protein
VRREGRVKKKKQSIRKNNKGGKSKAKEKQENECKEKAEWR